MQNGVETMTEQIKYPIAEIFDSIQGEGTYMGLPATFIRFAECNLSCSFCDTDFTKKEELTVEEILARVHQNVIVITGGEPLLYDLSDLLEAWLNSDSFYDYGEKFCIIETNGTRYQDWIEHYEGYIWIACSPKPQTNYLIQDNLYKHIDELKYVVDGSFTLDVIPDIDSKECNIQSVWLQPESSQMLIRAKEAYKLAMASKGKFSTTMLRVGCQLHKIIGVA